MPRQRVGWIGTPSCPQGRWHDEPGAVTRHANAASVTVRLSGLSGRVAPETAPWYADRGTVCTDSWVRCE